jgi:hypothetical protein
LVDFDLLAAYSRSDNSTEGLEGVTSWSGTALADMQKCRGWWQDSWSVPTSPNVAAKNVAAALVRVNNPKYKCRLCTHWEMSGGAQCKMKKGSCDFAHGPIELRPTVAMINQWGNTKTKDNDGPPGLESRRLSGGCDPLGAARSIEKSRISEGRISSLESLSVQSSAKSTKNNNKSNYEKGKYRNEK